MIRYIPLIAAFALFLYCLVDAIQTEEHRVRQLNKPLWILIIVIVPFAGSIAWLLAGRPQGGQRKIRNQNDPNQWRPDDDDAFLQSLKERRLKDWEDDLAEREKKLRGQDDDDKS